MLNAKIIYNKDCIVGYEFMGHAQYDINGKDIVCSSISTIHYMTKAYLDKLGIEYDYNESSGYSNLMLKGTQFLFTAQHPLKVLKLMMSELSKQYPTNVSITSLTSNKYNSDKAKVLKRQEYISRITSEAGYDYDSIN